MYHSKRQITYRSDTTPTASFISANTSGFVANTLDAHGSLIIRGRRYGAGGAGRLAEPSVESVVADIAFGHARVGISGSEGTCFATRSETVAAKIAYNY